MASVDFNKYCPGFAPLLIQDSSVEGYVGSMYQSSGFYAGVTAYSQNDGVFFHRVILDFAGGSDLETG